MEARGGPVAMTQAEAVMAFLRGIDARDLPSPEVCLEADGAVGFDWWSVSGGMMSASVTSAGVVPWAFTVGETKGHGRFDVDDVWPDAFLGAFTVLGVLE